MEKRPPLRRVDANILNKQAQTADTRWSSRLGVGRSGNSSPQKKKVSCYEMFKQKPSDLDRYFDWIELAQDGDRCRASVNAVMNLLTYLLHGAESFLSS